MVAPDRTREQAIESLRMAWHINNDWKKPFWDAQTLVDQELQVNSTGRINISFYSNAIQASSNSHSNCYKYLNIVFTTKYIIKDTVFTAKIYS